MKIPWPPRRGVRLNSKPLGKEGRLFTIGFILNLSLFLNTDQYQTHLWRQFELYCHIFSRNYSQFGNHFLSCQFLDELVIRNSYGRSGDIGRD